MKILISGGEKTQNIVNGLSKRFTSGGVDFLVVPFIENIDDIYQRGEYFDRAIIIEQCWNHDFNDTDEISIRHRINNFARSSSTRMLDNVSYVFLCQDIETANYVYEEILDIQSDSVVCVRAPRYSVNFFASLVTTELEQFPEDLVYRPIVSSIIDDMQPIIDDTPEEPEYNPDYDTDIMDDIIGEGEYNGNKLPGTDNGIFDIDLNKEEEIPVAELDPTLDFNDIFGNEAIEGNGAPEIEEPHITLDKSGELEDKTADDIPSDIGFDFGDPFDGFDDTPGEVDEPSPEIEIEDEPEPDLYTEPSGIDLDKSGSLPDVSGDDPMYYDNDPEDLDNPDQVVDEPDDFYEPPIVNDAPTVEPEEFYGDEPDENSEYNPELDSYSNNPGGYPTIDESEYEQEEEIQSPVQKAYSTIPMSQEQIKATFDAFANRGNSIVVTGCGGCGTSTVALNLANIINNLGYTVLLVDLDTENKAQSYISKDNYECVEPESAGLMAAVNSTSGINAHIAIVRQGFHLLTMGMSNDAASIEKIIHKEKISRFINLAKTSHNFVIYDVPFKTAVGYGSDFTFMADNIVVTLDCSNWGIAKTMLAMSNIENDDMQETMFGRGQLLFNRYRVLNKVMGRKVKTAIDITKAMDFKVHELIGEDPGYYFQAMHICGLINDDTDFESGWFESTQYSDTQKGSTLFLEILKNIVFKQ